MHQAIHRDLKMSAILEHFKVIFGIVQSIIILVMDVLRLFQWPAKYFLGNDTMLPFPNAIAALHFPIALFPASTVARMGHFSRANWKPFVIVFPTPNGLHILSESRSFPDRFSRACLAAIDLLQNVVGNVRTGEFLLTDWA